ncbi:MAG: hypothetical protein Q8M03_05160, partial [Legionella sp.]|nr:hypothetical protein [Legionella sp.]
MEQEKQKRQHEEKLNGFFNAKRILEEVKQTGLRPDTLQYNYLLRYCATQRLFPQLNQLWQEMQQDGVQLDVETYNVLLHICLENPYWRPMMHSTTFSPPPPPPPSSITSTHSPSSPNSYSAKSNHVLGVMEFLFNEMKKAGIKPNNSSYHFKMMILLSLNQLNQAL